MLVHQRVWSIVRSFLCIVDYCCMIFTPSLQFSTPCDVTVGSSWGATNSQLNELVWLFLASFSLENHVEASFFRFHPNFSGIEINHMSHVPIFLAVFGSSVLPSTAGPLVSRLVKTGTHSVDSQREEMSASAQVAATSRGLRLRVQ